MWSAGVVLLAWMAYWRNVEMTELTGPVTKEYCSPESFDVSCDPGHVILMRTAMYGRMRLSRCNTGVSLGCKSEVLAHMDKMCSGRKRCKVDVNDLEKVAQPCPKDYKAYLEVEYECVKATSTDVCATQTFVSLAGQNGYIVGQHGDGSASGSTRCTFSVEVDEGQRVGLYLYTMNQHLVRKEGGAPCRDHVVLQDGTDRQTVSLCGAVRPQRHALLFTSSENSVTIHTRLGRSQNEAVFILQYSAIGCPDLKVPKNAWTERSGVDLVVRCNTSGDIWYLTCQGNEWVGQIGNCTRDGPRFADVFGDGIPIQQGIALAVGVGIVVGAILGALLLLCVWTIKRGGQDQTKPAKKSDIPPAKGYITEERTNYPALLSTDRSTPETAVYEYTHVWDPRSQSMEKRMDMKVVPSARGSQYSTDTATGRMAGKGHFESPQSRIHLYETPKGVNEDDSKHRAGDPPVYFDLDPEIRNDGCDHGRPH